jgi:hypothetical protein
MVRSIKMINEAQSCRAFYTDTKNKGGRKGTIGFEKITTVRSESIAGYLSLSLSSKVLVSSSLRRKGSVASTQNLTK